MQFTSIFNFKLFYWFLFHVDRLTDVVSDSDTNSHEEGDDGEQGQQSVERRVRTMTTVTPNVPRIDRNVSETIAHTRQVRLVLSYAYNTKGSRSEPRSMWPQRSRMDRINVTAKVKVGVKVNVTAKVKVGTKLVARVKVSIKANMVTKVRSNWELSHY